MAGELVHAAGAEGFRQVVGGLLRDGVQRAFAEGFGFRDARFDQVTKAVLLVVGGRQRIAGRVPPQLVESVHVAIGLLRLAERADEIFERLAHGVAGVQREGINGGFAELIQVAVVVVAALVAGGFAPGGAAEVLQSRGFFALLPLVGQATIQQWWARPRSSRARWRSFQKPSPKTTGRIGSGGYRRGAQEVMNCSYKLRVRPGKRRDAEGGTGLGVELLGQEVGGGGAVDTPIQPLPG